ncbi:MAG TPA: 16S rRNA (guanine(966)-N(2))-methyltransferase RsmD, partial [Ornithinicoccus sp.]|nr:16S rRNA (guanine(966)-N(2))-methyltransferase RsmD [Ornithinicoccus sp.]
IVAGRLGGRRLQVPTGGHVRPTSDRVREALFSRLDTLVDLAGARVADLYAGSGAVGLEAYSRGARHVLLVESSPRAARTARANIEALGASAHVRLVVASVMSTLAAGTDEPYDVVFADPPYDLPDRQITELQHALLDGGWLAPGAVVVIERSSRGAPVEWVEPVTDLSVRRYGETALWYGRRT